MNVIVYTENGLRRIVSVAPGIDIYEEAARTVPEGVSYEIVDSGTLTSDPPSLDELYPPLAPYQFDAILQLAGLTESLAAVLASLPEQQRIVAQAKMNRMTSYWRSDPLLNQLGAALGLSDEDINSLWLQAAQL